MELLKKIKEHFAAGINGMRTLDNTSTIYSIRDSGFYGVAMKFDNEMEVAEHSNNTKIFTRTLMLENNVANKFLILACWNESLRNQFANLCADFVDLQKREQLLRNPIDWWNHWVGLLGNKHLEKKSYSVIAEMLALDSIYQQDKTVEWTSEMAGTHDFETSTFSCEVKSTVHKSDTKLTISSQHQLKSEKTLYLYFCRMEKSAHGVSIDDVKEMLILHGYDGDKLELQIEKAGFELGAVARKEKYCVLENRRYLVDNDFPKITNESFKGDMFPKAVVKITYEIDLEGIKYEKW